jgi:hypothetical protein
MGEYELCRHVRFRSKCRHDRGKNSNSPVAEKDNGGTAGIIAAAPKHERVHETSRVDTNWRHHMPFRSKRRNVGTIAVWCTLLKRLVEIKVERKL